MCIGHGTCFGMFHHGFRFFCVANFKSFCLQVDLIKEASVAKPTIARYRPGGVRLGGATVWWNIHGCCERSSFGVCSILFYVSSGILYFWCFCFYWALPRAYLKSSKHQVLLMVPGAVLMPWRFEAVTEGGCGCLTFLGSRWGHWQLAYKVFVIDFEPAASALHSDRMLNEHIGLVVHPLCG